MQEGYRHETDEANSEVRLRRYNMLTQLERESDKVPSSLLNIKAAIFSLRMSPSEPSSASCASLGTGGPALEVMQEHLC